LAKSQVKTIEEVVLPLFAVLEARGGNCVTKIMHSLTANIEAWEQYEVSLKSTEQEQHTQ